MTAAEQNAQTSAAEWDAHRDRIVDDLIGRGEPEIYAGVVADLTCAERFGDRPAEETTS